MTGLDYAAWFMLLLLAVIMIGVVFFIGNLPGSVAKKRNHPNVEAIVMGSWATLIFGPVQEDHAAHGYLAELRKTITISINL